jgi:hypothetical protein
MSFDGSNFENLKEIDGQITKLFEIAEVCWALGAVLKKYDSRGTASLFPDIELEMAWKQTFGTSYFGAEERP